MSVGRASRSLSSIFLALMILAPDTVAKDREANVELPVTWKFGENYWLERIKERRQYNGTSLQLSGSARTDIDVGSKCTRYDLTGRSMFLTTCSPRASNVTSSVFPMCS